MNENGCPVCGREACENPAHLPLAFVAARDLLTEPAPIDIVEGVVQAGKITALVSESGAGKTFVLLNLAAAITSDARWHGRAVKHGSVAYVSFEGDALGLRLRAISQHQDVAFEGLHILRASDPLSPRLTYEAGEVSAKGELAVAAALLTLATALAAAGQPPIRLLVIDTVRASLTGSEDNSENTAAYLRVIRRLLTRVPDAGAILAHHAGWQDGESPKKRERGSSAWRGNCDLTLYLEAEDADPTTGTAALTLKMLKVRDGERFPPLTLMRQRVDLAERNRRGEFVTSCIIASDLRTREEQQAEATARQEAQLLTGDLQMLRAIAHHPDQATSQDRLRLLVGSIRKTHINEALSRLFRKQWIRFPEKQRQPYTVTAAGRAALEEGAPTAH